MSLYDADSLRRGQIRLTGSTWQVPCAAEAAGPGLGGWQSLSHDASAVPGPTAQRLGSLRPTGRELSRRAVTRIRVMIMASPAPARISPPSHPVPDLFECNFLQQGFDPSDSELVHIGCFFWVFKTWLR